MKIRNGFVSNSSSSSFVVIFPREPKSAEDVKNILFDKGQIMFDNPYYDEEYDTNIGYTVEQISETVWNDIQNQTKNDFKKAKDYLTSGTIYGYDAPDYHKYDHIKDWHKKMEVYNAEMNKYAEKKMKEMFNIRKLKLQKINNEPVNDIIMYCFNYADEDGSYFSTLEHGNLFRKLKHVHISNH